MQHLNTLMLELAEQCNRGEMSARQMSLGLDAGCHADHLLTYLNSIVDDIACAIIQATGFVSPNPAKPIDGMGVLKGRVADAALAPVAALLAELDNDGSWWELAFKPKVGCRQLLIHNQHCITFQGAADAGQPFEAQAILMLPFGQTQIPDFFGLLRRILANLFDWLDRLAVTLTALLSAKSTWVPAPQCWFQLLPVGYPPGTTHLHPTYFVLPLCDGSDPLHWSMEVVSQPQQHSAEQVLLRVAT